MKHGGMATACTPPTRCPGVAVTGRGAGLTFMLASSRPLLLLSFSTKRGSTGDNLEIEAQNSLSLQNEDLLDSP